MKKITLAFLAIITLLASCNSDDPEDESNDRVLTKIQKTYSSGNTATVNFDGDKVTSYYYNETSLINGFEYDNNNNMTSFKKYYDGEVEKSYDFTYDANGKITSVHDYDSNPFFTYEPKNQDRVVTWNGNTMSIPLLVDDEANRYDNYEFTFNSDGLLSNYKVTEWDNDIAFDIDFSYDNNNNIVGMTGTYDVFGATTVDYELTYDDKVNPVYPHYNKYYINNIIIYGARQELGTLLKTIYKFGKNNPLKQDATSTNPNLAYYTYEYDGDYPTTAYYRSESTIATTIKYTY